MMMKKYNIRSHTKDTRMTTLYKMIITSHVSLSPPPLSLSLSFTDEYPWYSVNNPKVLYNHDTAAHYTLLFSHSFLYTNVSDVYIIVTDIACPYTCTCPCSTVVLS